jgi:hypothetical protein
VRSRLNRSTVTFYWRLYFSSRQLRDLAAIRRASSSVSSLAADRRPGLMFKINIGKLLPVLVAHDKAGVEFLD